MLRSIFQRISSRPVLSTMPAQRSDVNGLTGSSREAWQRRSEVLWIPWRQRGIRLGTIFALIAIWGFGAYFSPLFAAGKKDTKKKPVKVPPSRRVTIKPVDASTAADVAKSAKRIDELVDASHVRQKVTPNPRTTDEQFVRRIYLDISGTIPTYKQISVYLATNASDKRARLIDTLLNSPGYASHHFNYWADILRLTDRFDGNVTATAYNESIKQAL